MANIQVKNIPEKLHSIVDALMPTINKMPRIETTRIDDYCVAGGIVIVPPTVCIANAIYPCVQPSGCCSVR